MQVTNLPMPTPRVATPSGSDAEMNMEEFTDPHTGLPLGMEVFVSLLPALCTLVSKCLLLKCPWLTRPALVITALVIILHDWSRITCPSSGRAGWLCISTT